MTRIEIAAASPWLISLPANMCIDLGHYSGTPSYDPLVYATTSLLRPYFLDPNVKITESVYCYEDPVNVTTLVLRPGFSGPTVVALTRFHCNCFPWVVQECWKTRVLFYRGVNVTEIPGIERSQGPLNFREVAWFGPLRFFRARVWATTRTKRGNIELVSASKGN